MDKEILSKDMNGWNNWVIKTIKLEVAKALLEERERLVEEIDKMKRKIIVYTDMNNDISYNKGLDDIINLIKK